MRGRRQILKEICLLPFVVGRDCVGAEPETGPSKGQNDDPTSAHEEDEAGDDRVDWGLLCWWQQDTDREIVSIAIEFESSGTLDGMKQFVPLKIAIDDRQLLRRFELPPQFSPLRIAMSDRGGGGTGRAAIIGKIVVKTRQESFDILVTAVGFVLKGPGVEFKNMFFSYILAHTLDDIIFLKTTFHLPNKLLEALSGETRLQREKNAHTEIARQLHELDAKGK